MFIRGYDSFDNAVCDDFPSSVAMRFWLASSPLTRCLKATRPRSPNEQKVPTFDYATRPFQAS